MCPRAAVARVRCEAKASMQDLPQLARIRLQWKKDTPAPAVEEKDPVSSDKVEDTPAEEGTGRKDARS